MTADTALQSNEAMNVLTWMLIVLLGLLIIFCAIAGLLALHYFLDLARSRRK